MLFSHMWCFQVYGAVIGPPWSSPLETCATAIRVTVCSCRLIVKLQSTVSILTKDASHCCRLRLPLSCTLCFQVYGSVVGLPVVSSIAPIFENVVEGILSKTPLKPEVRHIEVALDV